MTLKMTFHTSEHILFFVYFLRARVRWTPPAYVAHFVFLRGVWIGIEPRELQERYSKQVRAINLATLLPFLTTILPT